MSVMWYAILFVCFIPNCFGSFCGESSIPFSFEVLSNGLPIIGCARPLCFGWNPDGAPVSKDAIFYKMDGYADGYMRESVDWHMVRLDDRALSFVPELAQCESSFGSRSCNVENEWVGGIAAVFNVSHSMMMALRCCIYERLRLSSDRGTATLANKQMTIGGEVLYKRRQYAFDYIANVEKRLTTNGSIFYNVQVRRMICLPPPIEQTLSVDAKVKEDVQDLLSAAIALQKKEAKSTRAFAFQAPLVSGGGDNKLATQTVAKVAPDIQNAHPEISPRTSIFDGSQAMHRLNNEQPSVGAFGAQNDGGFVDQGLASRVGPPPRIVGVDQGQPVYESSGLGGGGFFCFSGDTMVEKSDGLIIRVDELKLSDWILSVKNGKVVYTTLVKWIHRVPQQIAFFVKLFLEDGSVLKLTTKHYIYRTQCTDMNNSARIEDIGDEAVYAEKVKERDCLYRLSQDEKVFYKSRVMKVSNVMERGIYAPMTATGDIVVNGVLASCHNVVRNHILQDTFFGIVSIINEFSKFMFGAIGHTDSSIELPFGMDIVAWLISSALPHNT